MGKLVSSRGSFSGLADAIRSGKACIAVNQLLTSDLWIHAARLAKNSKQRTAAIAYVTAEHVKFGKGDTLICDASEWQIRRGATSASVLFAAVKRGAVIYHCDNLHAKVLLLDDCAVIGSANLSASSAATLEECAVLTRDRALMGQAHAFLQQLRERSRLLEVRDLERLVKLPVDKRWENPQQPMKTRTKPIGRRCWMVGLLDLDEGRLSGEERQAKNSGMREVAEAHPECLDHLEWFRMVGRSKFRQEAQPGDRLIIVSASGRNSKRLKIHRAVTLLSKVSSPQSDFFYYDETEATRFATISRARLEKLLFLADYKLAPSPLMAREIPPEVFESIDRNWPS